MPDFEVLETFGGHPFTVKQDFVRTPIGRNAFKTTHGDIDLGPIYKITSTTPTIGYVTPKTNSVSYLDPLIRSTSGIIGAKNVLE